MNGAILLGVMSVFVVVDMLIALRLAAIARSADSAIGAPPAQSSITPDAARRVSRVLFFTAPPTWLVVAALSFGFIPVDGIIPIKF